MAYIDSRSIKFYYEDSGSGEPVVFIHGSFSRGDFSFSSQATVFSQTHRFILPDLRGHGRTIAPLTWETPQLADDIICLLDALDVPEAHVVGHSMGGDVAMYCAIRHPSRIITATSIASTGVASNEVVQFIQGYHPDNLSEKKGKRFIDRLKRDHLLAHEGDWKSFILETIKNCKLYPNFTKFELSKISVPFLLLYGGCDPTINIEDVKRLRENIPKFSLRIVDHADHFLHMKNGPYEIVNSILLDFLSANKSQNFKPSCSPLGEKLHKKAH